MEIRGGGVEMLPVERAGEEPGDARHDQHDHADGEPGDDQDNGRSLLLHSLKLSAFVAAAIDLPFWVKGRSKRPSQLRTATLSGIIEALTVIFEDGV
jgi:hypothetical protein